ncbi:MAG: hypothetical protein HZC38_11540 [Chloroflexi bacterium]|nr:hypothetical protein [Chloroflexota bacterium]
MKTTVFSILVAMMLIAACSTPQPTLPALAAASQPTPASSVDYTAPLQPTVAQPAKLISKEFTPSNPKNVKLNAGKPQLVEFFAFW